MKPLTYYLDTPGTQRLIKEYGNYLQSLDQANKYELLSALTIVLWALSDPDFESPTAEDVDNSCLGSVLEAIAEDFLVFSLDPEVCTVLSILDPLDPQQLADIVPAVALYAAEAARQ
jgi:hypothetical protein